MSLPNVIHYPDTNSVEATWVDAEGVQIKCHSYADVQMDMLREDLGDDAATYADLIATVEASIQPAPPAPPAPPISVTPYQIREALNMLGLRAAVESAVAAGSQSLKDKWQFAQEFKRDNQTVIELGLALGKTDAEMDALFQLAETLTP